MAKPDLTEFYKVSRPRKPPCQVGLAKAQLDDEDRVALDAAVATDRGLITAAAIQTWLKNRGHSVSASAVASHRKGTCSCAEEG